MKNEKYYLAFLYRIAFKHDESPRKYIRKLLFKKNRQPRRSFKSIVLKRNGNIRKIFRNWALDIQKIEGISDIQNKKMESSLGILFSIEKSIENSPSSDSEIQNNHPLTGNILSDALSGLSKKCIISIFHDNYLLQEGGAHLCVGQEEKAVRARKLSYLNIYPENVLPTLAEANRDTIVTMILNGKTLGNCKISDLTSALAKLTKNHEFVTVIHHIMGHSSERIADLIKASSSSKCLFWLHDYFSLCPNYILQRNRIAFCNAPDVRSSACSICAFGRERTTHLDRMNAFFNDLSVTLLSPSESALEFWKSHSSLPISAAHVVPHSRIEALKHESLASEVTPDARFNIAHLGFPAAHKGWPVFEALALDPELQDRYKFVAFSSSKINKSIQRVPVHTTADNQHAMIGALKAENIDLALIWPNWPETFSFTTYEALVGGAYIVTNNSSGNVAATVRKTGRGAVLDTDSELIAFFQGGQAQQLALESRAARRTENLVSHMSDMSVPFL